MKTILIAVTINLAAITASFGQFGQPPAGPSKQVKVEDAIIVKERTLLVVRTENSAFNNKIEDLVKRYWKFNKNIEFVSEAKLEQSLAGNENKFCLLTIQDILITEFLNNTTFQNEYLRFALNLGEEAGKKKPLFHQNIAFKEDDRKIKKVNVFKNGTLDLEKKEILFALDFLQNHLMARAEGKTRMTFYYEPIENTGKLAGKTLLIARNDMDKNVNEQLIRDNYPYAFKIVDSAEIEKAYLQRSKEFAFVEIAPLGYSRGGMLHYIVNCEDGQTLSLGELYNGFGDSFSNLVNKDHLKAYVKNANRKGKK